MGAFVFDVFYFTSYCIVVYYFENLEVLFSHYLSRDIYYQQSNRAKSQFQHLSSAVYVWPEMTTDGLGFSHEIIPRNSRLIVCVGVFGLSLCLVKQTLMNVSS